MDYDTRIIALSKIAQELNPNPVNAAMSGSVNPYAAPTPAQPAATANPQNAAKPAATANPQKLTAQQQEQKNLAAYSQRANANQQRLMDQWKAQNPELANINDFSQLQKAVQKKHKADYLKQRAQHKNVKATLDAPSAWSQAGAFFGGVKGINADGTVNENDVEDRNIAGDFVDNIGTGVRRMGRGIVKGVTSLPGFGAGLIAGTGRLGYGLMTGEGWGAFSNAADAYSSGERLINDHIGVSSLNNYIDRENANDLKEYYERNGIDPNNKEWYDGLGLSIADVAGQGIGMAVASPGGALKGFTQAGKLGKAVGAGQKILNAPLEVAKLGLKGGWRLGKGAWTGARNAMEATRAARGGAATAAEMARAGATGAAEGAGAVAKSAVGQTAQTARNLGQGAEKVYEGAKSGLGNAYEGAKAGLKDALNPMTDALRSNTLGKIIRPAWNAGKRVVSPINKANKWMAKKMVSSNGLTTGATIAGGGLQNMADTANAQWWNGLGARAKEWYAPETYMASKALSNLAGGSMPASVPAGSPAARPAANAGYRGMMNYNVGGVAGGQNAFDPRSYVNWG